MLQSLAKWILRTSGWTTVGEIPDLDKLVFVASPHTSNWDGVWLVIYKVALNVRVRFLAKHSLFWWPLGSILSSLGAMPIDRRQTASTVNQLIDAFEREEHLLLALAPEGTRKWKPYWKTGFYSIAVAANVPIVLAYIDYEKKEMGIGITIQPSGNANEDLAVIHDFYRSRVPRHPELRGPVVFPPD